MKKRETKGKTEKRKDVAKEKEKEIMKRKETKGKTEKKERK